MWDDHDERMQKCHNCGTKFRTIAMPIENAPLLESAALFNREYFETRMKEAGEDSPTLVMAGKNKVNIGPEIIREIISTIKGLSDDMATIKDFIRNEAAEDVGKLEIKDA